MVENGLFQFSINYQAVRYGETWIVCFRLMPRKFIKDFFSVEKLRFLVDDFIELLFFSFN